MTLAMLLVSVLSARAQVSITGKVMDDAGSPVPGANVLERGTSNGTVTDDKGAFSLQVASANSTLVVSFIGFKTMEVPLNGQTTIDIALVPDATSLQEVVVTGYTSERKADIVSAISQVSALNTVAIPQGDVGQALQGRVAGVQVTSSGQPGQQAQVRIRGFGSFTSNNPLYIIDGVPTFDNTQINPYDIESQTVLKDAGAASIYGARAAAGVIVITTKHGKYDGKTNVSLDINTGATFAGEGQKNLNPTQQASKVYEALNNTPGAIVNGQFKGVQQYGADPSTPQLPDYINVGQLGKPNIPVFLSGPNQTPNAQALLTSAYTNYNVDPNNGQIIQVVPANKSGTDWYKALTRTAPTNRISLGLSSGNDRAHVYANFTYYDQQGIAINTYLRRLNLRLNSEFKPMKNVRVGENLLLTYRSNPFVAGNSGIVGTGNGGGNPSDENALNLAYRMATIVPVHDARGNWAGTAAPALGNPTNPVADATRLNSNYNQNVYSEIFGNTYIEIDPLPHLTLRSSFGGRVGFYRYLVVGQQTYEDAENTASNTVGEGMQTVMDYTFTNSVKYDNKFGNHSIRVFGGYEAIKNNTGRYIQGVGLNPFSLDPNYIGLSNTSPSGRQLYGGPLQPYTFASMFGKVDYNWSEKYYLSATIRRDGSSVFGPDNRYGVFPSVSGAWRLSSENFMKGVSWVTDLKIRGGVGTMGNTNALLNANAVNQYTLYTGGPANGYDINGSNSSVATGFIPLQVGNLAGKWETSTTTNIGLDGTFLEGTMDVILEFWQRNTTNVLFNPAFANTGGVLPNNPFVNVGAMTNKGIDLQIVKRIKINNDWSMTVDGNISPFQNKITAIATGQPFFDPTGGLVRGIQAVRNLVGQPMSSFYGYKMVGYFKDASDVSNSAVQDGAAPGTFKFANTSGTGTVNPNDRQVIGSPIPKFTYGLNVNVKYKNFFLTAFLYGVYGNKIYNFSKWHSDFYSTWPGAALSAATLQSWTPALGNNAKTPIISGVSSFSTDQQSNSWYVESGSYARLKNLQVGYDLPTSMLSKMHVSRVRFYLQAINLFTITKYTGKDPEVVGNVDITRGIDVGNYPATRQYMVGLNVGF